MKTSNAGLQLITRFEGVRLKAYDDGVGVWTIGVGHTGSDVHPGLTISMKHALELLREDLAGAEAQVNQLVKKPLNQSQYDALVSLVFNTGSAPLHGTLGSCLNRGDYKGASGEFGKWCKATKNGQLITLEGLVRRRAAETQMFNAAPTVHDLTHWLNQNERDWVTRYDSLDDAGKRNSREAHELQAKMRRQRKVIWRLAQPKAKGGDGNGWTFRHRVERYRSLKARTTLAERAGRSAVDAAREPRKEGHMEFVIIDDCPVPKELADEIMEIKKLSGAHLNSCDRSRDAEPFLAKFGKMSQRQLFEGFQQGKPGFNPANPPGFSTHERHNDGIAYPVARGARLECWQVGMDWDNPPAVIKAAAKRGWIVTSTYPTSAREVQHLNFRKEPETEFPIVHEGDTGPDVKKMTRVLATVKSPVNHHPYLPEAFPHYGPQVVAALKKFQKEHHQKPDGKMGPQTATQLAVAKRQHEQDPAHH